MEQMKLRMLAFLAALAWTACPAALAQQGPAGCTLPIISSETVSEVELGTQDGKPAILVPASLYAVRETSEEVKDDIEKACVRLTRGSKDTKNLEVVSGFLYPGGEIIPRPGSPLPIGIVLLDERKPKHNLELCEAMFGPKAKIRTAAEARRVDPNGGYLVTNWLLQSAVYDEENCGVLLRRYDFEWAKNLKTDFGLSGTEGPILLALDPTGEAAFLDLAGASTSQVRDVVRDWRSRAIPLKRDHREATAKLGLTASASAAFAEVAAGLSSMMGVGKTLQETISFSGPPPGMPRQFQVYLSGKLRIGVTYSPPR